jgi:hypothetical protein
MQKRPLFGTLSGGVLGTLSGGVLCGSAVGLSQAWR